MCWDLRLPIALAIALPIVLPIELAMEFPVDLLIAFGCLVEAFWYFVHDFLLPFGSLLAPFGRVERPFVDPGTTAGPVRAQDAESCEKVTILLQFGCARGPQIETILLILTTF